MKINGLTKEEVEKNQKEYGLNEITRKKHKTKLSLLLEAVIDPIIIIMIIAAVISFISGINDMHFTESIVIMSLVVVNVLINFIQSIKTQEELKALDELNQDYVTVIRDKSEQKIPSKELTIDDIVILQVGAIARADMEIITAKNISVDESFLTGESDLVKKANGDEIYSNSAIKYGQATARVKAIAMNTKIGTIASQVDQVDIVKSQLEIKILQITKLLLIIAIVAATVIFVLAMLNGISLDESFSLLISILIATVPEGLATVLTIVLTFMSRKMAENNALVKKVELVETLGEVEYVCTDKTGTITQNDMRVEATKQYCTDNAFDAVLQSIVEPNTPTTDAIYQTIKTDNNNDILELDKIPFNSETKKSVHLIQNNNQKYIYVIGAPDFVKKQDDQLEEINEYAQKALRTILIVRKTTTVNDLKTFEFDPEKYENYVLFGIQDPPKKSAINAIADLKKAHITTIMITGDNIMTAKSIAKQTNIITSDDDICIDAKELAKLSDADFLKIAEKIKVYARVQPEDKYRIVTILQKLGNIVAMTGDGTNDSIALKKANVGIAMGINGTDIAKESADLILLDDNFATINEAVFGGRLIFDNIQKFMRQMLTSNAAHTGSILFALIFELLIFNSENIILPMTPVLILWVNIISDAIPCLALGLDVPENDIMKKAPIDPELKIIDRKMIVEILIRGLSIGLLVYIAFTILINNNYLVEYARTVAFIVLSFGQLIHIFDARAKETIYRKNPFENKYLLLAVLVCTILNLSIVYTPLNQIFGLAPISFTHLITAIIYSGSVTYIYSIVKLFLIRKSV